MAYPIHGGAIVCCQGAVQNVMECGGVDCGCAAHWVRGGGSCAILGGSSWRSFVALREGRLGLCGSWERARHARLGWLGAKGGCARGWALLTLRPSPFWTFVSSESLPSVPFPVLSLHLPPAFPPPPRFFCFGLVTMVACGLREGGPSVIAALGVGKGACWCRCWPGRHGAVGRLWHRGLRRECRGGWWFGGRCASGSLCVCRLLDIWWILIIGAPATEYWRWAVGDSSGVAPVGLVLALRYRRCGWCRAWWRRCGPARWVPGWRSWM